MNQTKATERSPDTTVIDVQAVCSQLVNSGLVYLAVVIPFALVVSFSRIYQHGWHPIHMLHVGLAALVITGTIFRRQLSYRVRACLLLGVFLIVGTAGLLVFGLLAGGLIALAVFPIVTTVVFGMRAGLAACAMIVAIIAATGFAVHMGGLTFSIDIDKYATSITAWSTMVLTLLLWVPVTVIGLGVVHEHLVGSLHRLRKRSSLYHEKIFGLFDQLDPNVDGSGIGLALVKRIIEVHGGRIWVESEGPGHGSTFCFTIGANCEAGELAET